MLHLFNCSGVLHGLLFPTMLSLYLNFSCGFYLLLFLIFYFVFVSYSH